MDEQQKEKKSKDILEEAIASVKNIYKEEKQPDENTEKSQEELLKIISDLKSKVSGLEKEIQDDDVSIDEEEIDDNDVTEDASEENIETDDDKYDSELTEKEDSIESQTGNVEKHITPKKKLTILSAFLSTLCPGMGQLYVGQYKRASILLSAPIIAIIISILILAIPELESAPLIVCFIITVLFAIYIWNIYDAVKITDKTNTANGFSKSLTSDKLSEYGWGGKVGLIIFRIIFILFAIILLPITLPIRVASWIMGKMSQCPHCGRDGGLKKIDTFCTGRSNSYYKKSRIDKETHLFETQELLITYRCKYCNYEYQKRKKKEVQLD